MLRCSIPAFFIQKFTKLFRIFIDILENLRIILVCMDIKSKTMAISDATAKIRGRKTVVGAKQLRKSLQNGTADFVFLARNADPAITEPMEALCRTCSVEYAWIATMAELGRACGIEVGAAAAAVLH
jgi:large subunit ribosomal protein L7A